MRRPSTQRGPQGERKRLEMVGSGKTIPSKDEEIGLVARNFLQGEPDGLVVLVDDLERARVNERGEIFRRYRTALDPMSGPHFARVAFHFLVNKAFGVRFCLNSGIYDRATGPQLSNNFKSLAGP